MMNTVLLAQAADVCTAETCKYCETLKTPEGQVVAAAAFVLGVVVTLLVKAVFCGGKKKCGCAKKNNAQKKAQPRAARDLPPRMPVPAGSVELYVGNLSYDLTEEALTKLFAEFGTIASARVVTNRFNDKSKGFGFVVMPNRDEAEKAIAAMNDKEVLGRKMRVNEAKNTIKE